MRVVGPVFFVGPFVSAAGAGGRLRPSWPIVLSALSVPAGMVIAVDRTGSHHGFCNAGGVSVDRQVEARTPVGALTNGTRRAILKARRVHGVRGRLARPWMHIQRPQREVTPCETRWPGSVRAAVGSRAGTTLRSGLLRGSGVVRVATGRSLRFGLRIRAGQQCAYWLHCPFALPVSCSVTRRPECALP